MGTEETQPTGKRGKPATSKTAPWVCAFVLRMDFDGGRIVCAQPAKRSYLGARCCEHWPAAVLA